MYIFDLGAQIFLQSCIICHNLFQKRNQNKHLSKKKKKKICSFLGGGVVGWPGGGGWKEVYIHGFNRSLQMRASILFCGPSILFFKSL